MATVRTPPTVRPPTVRPCQLYPPTVRPPTVRPRRPFPAAVRTHRPVLTTVRTPSTVHRRRPYTIDRTHRPYAGNRTPPSVRPESYTTVRTPVRTLSEQSLPMAPTRPSDIGTILGEIRDQLVRFDERLQHLESKRTRPYQRPSPTPNEHLDHGQFLDCSVHAGSDGQDPSISCDQPREDEDPIGQGELFELEKAVATLGVGERSMNPRTLPAGLVPKDTIQHDHASHIQCTNVLTVVHEEGSISDIMQGPSKEGPNGRFGATKSLEVLRGYFYWPKMKRILEKCHGRCITYPTADSIPRPHRPSKQLTGKYRTPLLFDATDLVNLIVGTAESVLRSKPSQEGGNYATRSYELPRDGLLSAGRAPWITLRTAATINNVAHGLRTSCSTFIDKVQRSYDPRPYDPSVHNPPSAPRDARTVFTFTKG